MSDVKALKEAPMRIVARRRYARRRYARRRYVLGLFRVALFGAFLWLLFHGGPFANPTHAGDGAGSGALADSSASFTIGGDPADPISPGVSAPLNLKLTNPHATPLLVTDLRVRVQKVSAPHADLTHPCTVDDFAVKQDLSRQEISLPARSTSTLNNLGIPSAMWPQLRMLNRGVKQDGCKAASLTLTYTASGTPEN